MQIVEAAVFTESDGAWLPLKFSPTRIFESSSFVTWKNDSIQLSSNLCYAQKDAMFLFLSPCFVVWFNSLIEE